MTCAVDLPETAGALERYRRRAVELTVSGVVVIALAVGVGSLLPGAWTSDAAALLGGLGAVALLGGLGARRIERRMRRVLGAGAWSAHAAVPVERPWSSATVVLSAPESEEAWPLAVVAFRHRYDAVRPGPQGVLWWCGDPRAGGVLAPLGGGELIWAKPVRGRGARLRIVRRAGEAGLRGRPEPLQPQQMRQAPKTPQAAKTHPASQSPQAQRVRRWGLWRWVVLVAAVAFGLGVYGTEASDGDPQVDLTVLSKQADGSCTVAWKDPFDGGRRTGPYRCATDLDPVLEGWDTGFVVSYGPWKGDLYNADWQGTPAGTVNEVLGLGGIVGLLVGLGGGGVSWWRRRPAAPVPYPAPGTDTPRVSLSQQDTAKTATPALTYARLAAQAERDPLVQTREPRPEPDVREVPWWRTRGLRRVSGLSEVLIGVATCVGMGALILTAPDGFSGIQSNVIGVLVLGGTVVSGYRFVTGGRPAAVLLVRAARAPVPVPRRYVLLHDPYGGAPVLALFPMGDGADDEPEALLVLASPGTRRHPWVGLPSAPAGSVELRGWLDHAANGAPVVVPRIEDRVLWPQEPYLEAGTPQFAELAERLGAVAPQEAARDSL
ncbi:hypothetical protein [Streptomyces sp. NBC_00572]|uniref:hypothetical protein n=1 Tax=Streptomyces sp. NBC_00572 TaxID=2903664 RepID=UPI002258BB73|nr:hypothetical protein [Streptomyces sp. NBC_00572]MCX4981810.1 hypothetical protein [Streptomyces sp. NBC_00572]